MNNVLYARTSGQGPDLILLHGLFGQCGNLRSVARALETHFRVHCLDLPDHGRSPWLQKPLWRLMPRQCVTGWISMS